jgi:hypothetical protein
MAGREAYSRSASGASPPKTSYRFSQPTSSEGQLGRTVLDKDWGHVLNKHKFFDGGGGSGGGGEGLSSNNSNDFLLKDRKDPEVPAEDLSSFLGPESEPLDISQLLSEYSELPGVAEKDFVGEHAKQVIITS